MNFPLMVQYWVDFGAWTNNFESVGCEFLQEIDRPSGYFEYHSAPEVG